MYMMYMFKWNAYAADAASMQLSEETMPSQKSGLSEYPHHISRDASVQAQNIRNQVIN